jgi:stearoyl-CoA desaturase (delta-9 desaturase)
VTWSINSICHIWGSRPFKSHDKSTNNWLFAIIGFGEGWHNNHHAFPASARHGLKWWQIDASYMIIKTLSWVKLVKNIRVPSAEHLKMKAKG